jgi:DNA-binding IclR family transcriptional regulator
MMANRGTSLRRGLQILAALGSEAAVSQGGLGVTQLAALTGHEKSQVSRTLAVLTEYGLAERSPGGTGYRLGWECFALAARTGQPRLIQDATGALEELVSQVGEAAHLSVLHGAQILTLLTRSPAHAIVARGWVGRTVPAYCTSSGRALLLDHDRDALVDLLGPGPFPAHGPNAPEDVAELERRIRRARRLGYAVADEESEPGLVAAAAPVRDFTGHVVAAVNVSGPKFRMGERLHHAGELARAAAEQISANLGAPVAPAADCRPTPRNRRPAAAESERAGHGGARRLRPGSTSRGGPVAGPETGTLTQEEETT